MAKVKKTKIPVIITGIKPHLFESGAKNILELVQSLIVAKTGVLTSEVNYRKSRIIKMDDGQSVSTNFVIFRKLR